jgi:hypothetical protein
MDRKNKFHRWAVPSSGGSEDQCSGLPPITRIIGGNPPVLNSRKPVLGRPTIVRSRGKSRRHDLSASLPLLTQSGHSASKTACSARPVGEHLDALKAPLWRWYRESCALRSARSPAAAQTAICGAVAGFRACHSLVKCRKTFGARLDRAAADRRSDRRPVDPRKAWRALSADSRRARNTHRSRLQRSPLPPDGCAG